MARNLEKQNGVWVDKNNGNNPFVVDVVVGEEKKQVPGHVHRDLEKGDMFLEQKGTKKYQVQVMDKIITSEGFIIVSTTENEI